MVAFWPQLNELFLVCLYRDLSLHLCSISGFGTEVFVINIDADE